MTGPFLSIDQLSTDKFIELQAYANAQYEALQNAKQTINKLEQEIAHLKHLLTSTPLVDKDPVEIIVSDYEAICDMQIQRLKETSFKRELTLEETKRFDLLVKNLILAKEGKKDINPAFKNLHGVSSDTLMLIASQPEPTEDM